MISGEGISKESQSDGPSIWANHRSVPEIVSSIETSHRPEEPFARSPRFSSGMAELAWSAWGLAMNRFLHGYASLRDQESIRSDESAPSHFPVTRSPADCQLVSQTATGPVGL